ncbi:fructose-bisphosphate aldolase, class II [Thermanaeromonas toyohensis ToBE]|uniref:Fructose-bisphosphate aldolase, class II n=1 Tax=Thermanaeromonas toyohensis ToBE TaxID=698762 RepID=A0A1W1VBZ2_9FIRM|nr:class II fructose-bisphosphate aldolase [Thermanaeromonas toyohensis]SMB90919.1 fructose-bisphosphate aldolase, class II [Thermanaeromonas toyohensis ToBE]
MPIVTLKEILQDAFQNRYAVGAFNVINVEMLDAILSAAIEEQAPIILAYAPIHKQYISLETIAPLMLKAAREAPVPVAVHLDHGQEFADLIKAMHYGFTSVMFDGSTLPYEENVYRTQEIVKIARVLGVSVEAELGHVGGAEGGAGGIEDPAACYTDVEQAADFVARTGIDALAVAIGTVHGIYRFPPKLDFARLKAIKERVNIPLVLHGGSGLSEEDFRQCIARGIAKINIFTDMSQAAVGTLKETLCTCNRPSCDPSCADTCLIQRESLPAPGAGDIEMLVQRVVARVLQELNLKSAHRQPTTWSYPELVLAARESIKAEVKKKIRIFGSSGKASKTNLT